LDSLLAGSLPAAIQARVTALNNLLTALASNPASVLGALPQSLVTGLTGAVAELNQIRDILRGLVVTPINSAIQDIKDWWAALGGKTQHLTSGGELPASNVGSAGGGGSNLATEVQNTWNALVNGLLKTVGVTGQTPTEVQSAADSIATGVDSAQSSTIYTQTLLTMPRYSPRWLSSGQQDDVSFPVFGITTTVTPSLGELVLIPVTAETSRAHPSVRATSSATWA
jgi:hypothetical protein